MDHKLLTLSDLISLQEELCELKNWQYKDIKTGRNSLLWMIVELGETADIIKKKGDKAIMNDEVTRTHFIEELSDVLMYYAKVLLTYQISGEDLSKAFIDKHNKNIGRDFKKEEEELFNK